VCDGRGRVFHYGHNILQYYQPSLGRGRNILKAININDSKLIFDIEETDSEVLFRFKSSNFEILEKYIKPKLYYAKKGGSPFSVKYLNKGNVNIKKYDIPMEDLALYKEITSLIPKGNISVYLNINNGFMAELTTKKYSNIAVIKEEIKASGLGQRDYFHSIGEWKSYIEYIKNYMKEQE
jgi:hypothetical protein